MRSDYCVYYHKDKEGIIKYVGSGTLKRPSRWSNRNKSWHKLFDNEPFFVEIVESGLTKLQSLELEEKLIEEHRETIVNVSKPKAVKELTYEFVSSIVEISETSPSGLVWKVPAGRYGRIPARSIAGSLTGKPEKRYWLVNYTKYSFSAHRAIYLLANGSISTDLVINHIDGDSTNNRIENLEQISQSHNVYKTNKAGYSSLGRSITIRYHNGKPMSVVARFCFEPNKETQKNFGVRACGSLDVAIKLAQEWRKAAEESLQLSLN